MRRTRGAGLILALVAVFLVDRLAVLASSGHLFTDVNPAEYGFLSVVSDFGGRPVTHQLTDPRARADLLHAFRLVGNQMHGTLGALGVAMLAVVQHTDVVLGTGLLRAFGLGQATLTVLLWLVGLWRATRSRGVLVGFTLLAILGPPVWTGLNLLCWGTHETVGLVQAAVVCVALPWMAHPVGPRGQLLRAVGLGVAAGVATLLNPALALPAVSATAGVAGAGWLHKPSWRRFGWAVGSLLVAGLVGLGTLQWVLATGWLDGLGYPRGLPVDKLTGLIGKDGGPLLHRRTASASEVTRWAAEARAQAFLQAPTSAYGVHARVAEWVARLGTLGVGVVAVSMGLLRGRPDGRPFRRTAGWVGLHLVLGFVATLVLTRHTSLDPSVPTGAPPRYFAHLYPFGFAVLALVAGTSRVSVGRFAAMGVAVWVAWVGLFEHARWLDPVRLDPTEARIALQYDGAAAWFTDRPRSTPSADRRPFPDHSDDFRRGYAVISGLQSARYWSWTRPRTVARSPDHVAEAFVRSLRPSADISDPRAYWLGVGAALRVAVPRSRMPHAASFWKRQGRWAEVVREGYESPP